MIKRYFQSLSRREQKIVFATFAFVAILSYIAIFLKSSGYRTENIKEHENAVNTFKLLNSISPTDTKTDSARQKIPANAAITVINNVSKAHNLSIRQIQPQENGTVSIIIHDQPFDSVVDFLFNISFKHGLSIESISATSSFDERSGLVNTNVTFSTQ